MRLCNKKLVTFYWLYMLITNGIAENASTTASYKKDDCLEWKDPGKATQCVGEKWLDKKISNTTMIYYLSKILDRFQASTTFYGIGYTTGVKTSVVAGSQKHPMMKGWSIDINAKNIMSKTQYLDIAEMTTKPIALYLSEDSVVPDAFKWTEKTVAMSLPTGTKEVRALFTSSAAGKLPKKVEQTNESCKNWYNWEQRRAMEDMPTAAFIMDPKTWCPTMKEISITPMVARLREIKTLTVTAEEKMYDVEWALTPTGSFGNVPAEYNSVFQ